MRFPRKSHANNPVHERSLFPVRPVSISILRPVEKSTIGTTSSSNSPTTEKHVISIGASRGYVALTLETTDPRSLYVYSIRHRSINRKSDSARKRDDRSMEIWPCDIILSAYEKESNCFDKHLLLGVEKITQSLNIRLIFAIFIANLSVHHPFVHLSTKLHVFLLFSNKSTLSSLFRDKLAECNKFSIEIKNSHSSCPCSFTKALFICCFR